MDLNNIALVRATNIIPFDGIIKCINNSLYLCKNIACEYSAIISDLLKESSIIPPLDYSKMSEEDYYDNYVKNCNEILKEYLPFLSNYNSCVLFSLNGICPDDAEVGFGNNTFSDKKCAIIEPLADHISDVISLIPTDTAIKDDVVLSNEAIVLIDTNTYDNLSLFEKNQLANLSLTVKLFSGNLKDAIKEELQKTNRFYPEDLTLSRKYQGYLPSKTSKEQIANIANIAKNYNLATIMYYNILTSNNNDIDKLDNLKDELDNAYFIQDYYLKIFLAELLIITNHEELKEDLETNLHNPQFMLKIKNIIKAWGIANYYNFVNNYNKNLLEKQQMGTLLTPNAIIASYKNNLGGKSK